jgi:hypothetical protein
MKLIWAICYYGFSSIMERMDIPNSVIEFSNNRLNYDDAVIRIVGANVTKRAKGWTNERTPYGLAVEDPAEPCMCLFCLV